MSDDPIVLSFKDITLYQSDVDILRNRYKWLNDAIISFYFEYLSDKLPIDKQTEITFLNPTTVFMLSYLENSDNLDEINSILGPLNLPDKACIFIPINDNSDPSTVAGGSHWSILVFVKNSKQFYYYDSIVGQTGNSHYAMIAARKLSMLLTGVPSKEQRINIRQAPKQTNGHDCGLYLLSITEFIVKRMVDQHQSLQFTDDIEKDMISTLTPQSVTGLRQNILDLVTNLKAKASN
ncbi:hypothetical protein SAMD00019534_039210 [Acytostelium subglobosum LB1]|uniref:hypothetical protein n=1 Tax=Acytostelium subglobosum LB1 TaxID=1410327 RepID=UPI0006448708|nr:hypothetical protein SAMD00019534_039210 [Acytostelium subglobosum LB1]GAM20746.1 hypothetical protein SAMD00019534_039210 [Acytostelium subglobosum LB1]|eukprot:XP_012755880.1 hypothetical protein SAMD00019534_039210 [Acytostelium subglobosum LB1]